jgi:hypothetical protein
LVAELNAGDVVAGLEAEMKDEEEAMGRPVPDDGRVGTTVAEVTWVSEEVVSTTGEVISLDEVDSGVIATVVDSAGVAVVSVSDVVLGVLCVSD